MTRGADSWDLAGGSQPCADIQRCTSSFGFSFHSPRGNRSELDLLLGTGWGLFRLALGRKHFEQRYPHHFPTLRNGSLDAK